jgi:hypothetical protein
MGDQQLLLDAFAVVRRTWDDLVGLQPDVLSAGSMLDAKQLNALDERLGAHQEAVDMLVDVLQSVSLSERTAHPES